MISIHVSDDDELGSSQPSNHLAFVRSQSEDEENEMDVTFDDRNNGNLIEDPILIDILELPDSSDTTEGNRKRKQPTENDERPRKKTTVVGRSLDKAWIEFNQTDDKTKVKCKHCKTDVSGKVERLRTHLKKCKLFKKTECQSTGVIVSRIREPVPMTPQQHSDSEVVCLTPPQKMKHHLVKIPTATAIT